MDCMFPPLQVFFAVLIGIFSLGQAVSNFDKIVTAVGASLEVYTIIHQVSNNKNLYPYLTLTKHVTMEK